MRENKRISTVLKTFSDSQQLSLHRHKIVKTDRPLLQTIKDLQQRCSALFKWNDWNLGCSQIAMGPLSHCIQNNSVFLEHLSSILLVVSQLFILS